MDIRVRLDPLFFDSFSAASCSSGIAGAAGETTLDRQTWSASSLQQPPAGPSLGSWTASMGALGRGAKEQAFGLGGGGCGTCCDCSHRRSVRPLARLPAPERAAPWAGLLCARTRTISNVFGWPRAVLLRVDVCPMSVSLVAAVAGVSR